MSLQDEIDKLESKLSDAMDENFKLQGEIEDLEQDIDDLTRNCTDLEMKVADLEPCEDNSDNYLELSGQIKDDILQISAAKALGEVEPSTADYCLEILEKYTRLF